MFSISTRLSTGFGTYCWNKAPRVRVGESSSTCPEGSEHATWESHDKCPDETLDCHRPWFHHPAQGVPRGPVRGLSRGQAELMTNYIRFNTPDAPSV